MKALEILEAETLSKRNFKNLEVLEK